MATVTLGNIKLNWKGAYNAGTAYAIDDVVSYNGSSYVAKTATTGNLPTVTANWDIMSQAGTNGTNGTDLTSTLTTQGDIVYRDGSGLARLGYGTAGQVLQTGGSGANPSWGTVSSDFVKLTSGSITSSTADLTMDNLFSSTYRAYKFIFTDFNPVSNNQQLYFRYRVGTTDQSDNKYTHGSVLSYFNGSSNTGQNTSANNTGGRIGGWGCSNLPANAGQYSILLSDPRSTRSAKSMFYTIVNPKESNSYWTWESGMNVYHNNQAVDGIKWYIASGNILYMNYVVYGLKH